MDYYFSAVLWLLLIFFDREVMTIPSNVQGLLLSLHLEITPSGAWRNHMGFWGLNHMKEKANKRKVRVLCSQECLIAADITQRDIMNIMSVLNDLSSKFDSLFP